ncbi:MAG: gamma-glutamylcyclotransferase [Alphaproteobacteria bacterium]|nr:gamma-glutamylcyclotransferase [Alphaproteobacteria bacterium]
MAGEDGDLWVFGYGSLMWRPGFAHEEAVPALLRGYHRSFCVYSYHYRGTPDRPGLVLGLEPGGACRGVAFRVAANTADDVLAYLDAREIPHEVYRRRLVTVELHRPGESARRVKAHAYIVRRDRAHYAGRLPVERSVELFLQGEGLSGRAHDYLENTVTHLEAMGFRDPRLHDLLLRVRARLERG